MDNTGNDLHHEIKFNNCKKNKNNFFMKKSLYFLILGKVVFMSPQNSIASAFCFAEADTKKEIC